MTERLGQPKLLGRFDSDEFSLGNKMAVSFLTSLGLKYC